MTPDDPETVRGDCSFCGETVTGRHAIIHYLFQGENPAVYGGREADNSLTFHRRLQSEYPTTANLY